MDEESAPEIVPQAKLKPQLLLIGGLAVVGLVVVVSLLLMVFSSPEKDLVNHIEAVDKIMRKNMDEPEKGVEKLIKYFEENGPEAAKTFVELGIELSQIEGDGDLEDRLEKIRKRAKTPLKNFAGTAEKFSKKVEEDKDARKRVEEYGKQWKILAEALEELGRAVN